MKTAHPGIASALSENPGPQDWLPESTAQEQSVALEPGVAARLEASRRSLVLS